MTRIKLKWKPVKDESPVYLEEAAQRLDTSYHALRQRVLRMVNDQAPDTLPTPKKEQDGRQRWHFERDEFDAFLKAKQQLDKILKGSGK